MRYLCVALIGIGLLIPNVVDARPVSYPSGWTYMLMNDGMKNTAHIHYSPTAKMSVGYKFEYWRDMDFSLHALQVNNLITRWNQRDSQANFYLMSGLGVVNSNASNNDSGNEFGGFVGMATDWEDRRYFVAYSNRYTHAGNSGEFFTQSARAGWAPYEGDYGDLHTWLMLQVDHTPEAQDNFTITPLVRLFKGLHLMEAGINNHGEILFNYVYRY